MVDLSKNSKNGDFSKNYEDWVGFLVKKCSFEQVSFDVKKVVVFRQVGILDFPL